jgi:Saf4/Yju2 protein
MSERKVLAKYYPPDFDPSKLTKRGGRKGANRQQTVRLMTPYSMRCNTCGEYIYRGKKFNARKEDAQETYLGIKILRFYIRCTRCSAEITFKTDPKNLDYEAERGASRNFEPWREEKPEETDEERLARLEAEANPMKDLEKKQMDSKREMEEADALDQVRERNARINKAQNELNPDIILNATRHEDVGETEEEKLDREAAELWRKATQGANGEVVRRISDPNINEDTIKPASLLRSSQTAAAAPPPVFTKPTEKKKMKEERMKKLGIVKKKSLI